MKILLTAIVILAFGGLLPPPKANVGIRLSSWNVSQLHAAELPTGLPHRPKKTITVIGTLIAGGVECQAFRSDMGQLYTLTGNLGRLRNGDKVTVVGRLVQISTCQQGTTLVVESIRKTR